jgi:hypothetical protein
MNDFKRSFLNLQDLGPRVFYVSWHNDRPRASCNEKPKKVNFEASLSTPLPSEVGWASGGGEPVAHTALATESDL